jgi:HlyD family secretion protein
MLLFKKLSLWAALLGIAAVVFLVRSTTASEPMPALPLAPALKPPRGGIGAAGLVEALRENTAVGVPVAGLIAQVYVKVWDRVEAGAPLLQIDDRELTAQLPGLRAEVRVQEMQLARARRQAARTEALRATRGVSEDEADSRRDDLAIQEARVEAARAALAKTESLIERLTVRAPVAGTILQITARAGEYAAPGGAAPPILLGAIDEVQVRADVDEQLAPRVRPGSKATGYLKGDSRTAIPLEFVRIEPYVVPKRSLTGSSSERVDTRVLQVIFKFPNDLARRIYVGQQMDLFIEEAAAPAS